MGQRALPVHQPSLGTREKPLIKQESAAKPQERCQVGKGGAKSLPFAGGLGVARAPEQGTEGLASPSHGDAGCPSASLPSPLRVCAGSQGEPSGIGPSAPRPPQPVERPAPRPQHKAVPGPGHPDNKVGLPGAWHVYGEPRDRSSPLSF